MTSFFILALAGFIVALPFRHTLVYVANNYSRKGYNQEVAAYF